MRNYLLVTLLCLITTISQAAPPAIQLATIYHQDVQIEDYWVSEKLDGVRGYWDGKNLISRQGNHFNPPAWFTKDFPDIPLDGELWIGRSQFSAVSGILRKKSAADSEWKKVKFMIFDLPSSPETFTNRIKLMTDIIKHSNSPYLKMIKQQKLSNNRELQTLLEELLTQGGEGLMLHKGSALYQAKRSKDLMKLKKYQDAEAVVLQHFPGKGRNKGRLGSLLVKTETGIIFKIGSGFSDLQRENPPAIGSTITYQYIGKTKNNVPRFASFMRVRESF